MAETLWSPIPLVLSGPMPLIFQYGSNCDTERLNSPERLAGAAIERGRAQSMDEYEIEFDVWSNGNGCAAADLVQSMIGNCF